MSKAKASDVVNASLVTPAVAELVAIAAAIGANCEPCFKHHCNEARKLAVSRDDMLKVVELADRVKRAPARNMLMLADKLLDASLSVRPPIDPNPGSCCSAHVSKPTKAKKKGQ
jgi:AhpD family alkylhydroperoxidase